MNILGHVILNSDTGAVNYSSTERSPNTSSTQQSSSSNSGRITGNSGTNNSGTDNGAGNDDTDQQHNYSIPPLRVLLQSREAIGQYIFQNFTEVGFSNFLFF